MFVNGKRRKRAGMLAALTLAGICLCGCAKEFGKGEEEEQKTVQIGVAVYNEKDAYIGHICHYLDEEIKSYEKEHPNIKIRREISDAGGSQQEQNSQIEQFVSLEYDLLLVNIVDRTNATTIIDQASKADIPVVFFNREPVREDIFRTEGIYYEGSNAKDSALLQADLIADSFEKSPGLIDQNGDGVISFAMLEGESNHQDTLIRSEWVLKGLEQRGVETKKIISATANWERGQAAVLVRQWLEKYEDEIELIICNNDDMALGAWDSLEETGQTDIQVVGIDGVEEVRELVKEKKILGTVLCDTQLHAKALLAFIEALAIDRTGAESLPLTDERYYMIPLSKIVQQ